MDPMRAFLTEENILIHKEYMRILRLRHSIMEKSIPEIKNKNALQIEKMRISASCKEEILANYREYLAHELYCKSFSEKSKIPDIIKKHYSSCEAFLYEVYLASMREKHGFIFVFLGARGIPEILHSEEARKRKDIPKLALDISEHAYFLDYRFEKEKYLRSAISNLNLILLDNE